MEFLDADEKLLKDDKKNKAKRDIVQFVQLNKAKQLGNLQEEVMREIPEQVCGYMEHVGYKINEDKLKAKKLEAEEKITRMVLVEKEKIIKRSKSIRPAHDHVDLIM